MNTTTIVCPHCKKSFEISDTIQYQIEDELLNAKTEQSEALRKEFDAQAEERIKQAFQSLKPPRGITGDARRLQKTYIEIC